MSNSNWTREALKLRAKDVLRVNYWQAFLVSLLLGVATGGLASGGSSVSSSNGGYNGGTHQFGEFMSENPAVVIGLVIAVVFGVLIAIGISLAFRAFVGGPLEVSCQKYFAVNAVEPHTRLEGLGFGFQREHYMSVVKTTFLRTLYVFLWTLLFIIPGIVKAYMYRMVPYILAENPNIDTKEALELSKKMMDGEKWNAFLLDMSFIGWYILGMLACGIGVLFVAPYHNSANAQLYWALKEKHDMTA